MLNRLFNCSHTNATFKVYDSITKVDHQEWEAVDTSDNIYLSIPYLLALEQGMSATMNFRYVTFFNSENLIIGVAVFQLVHFKAKELLQERIPCSIADKVQTYFLNDKKLSLLICGNLYACGENGFAFQGVEKSQFLKILTEVILELQNTNYKGDKISFSLIKEFWLTDDGSFSNLNDSGFLDFNIDVNMILKLRSEWSSFDDYLESMNTKYRTRAKAVLKKSKAIEVLELEANDIEKHSERISFLYEQVLQKANYNLGVLDVRTFLELKNNLGNKFIFKGYFLDGVLVGFTSSFFYRDIIDANFVGIDYNINNTYKLYQRMLYDFVNLGIQHEKKVLRLGRTAETSKSAIGALPVEMKLFARHRNLLPSKLLKPLISSIQPDEFELRRPFKK
ncbi:hypothetical protein [Flavicella sp.]|uniref:hypothetical protein n=1 Tax=Flavicella sp. TaxID=2957742 RepID=UPI0026236F83|nr:hypothetical protein [Flavicella sp.]MDG1804885.1 hypothetical protein [Flavicella sp.]